ncbi:MAG TPA: hypothetical protein VHO67_08970 [Polyangia bacterium]|nr:hypothetical protein [Polyangia bacterium]
MSGAPQKKITRLAPARVSLVVALTMVGLTLGGILAIFAAPLRALVAR